MKHSRVALLEVCLLVGSSVGCGTGVIGSSGEGTTTDPGGSAGGASAPGKPGQPGTSGGTGGTTGTSPVIKY
jgi:hypothetical protein